MKEEFYQLINKIWEYAKECIAANPDDHDGWKKLHEKRQQICDGFLSDPINYIFIRNVTNAFLDWFEEKRKEKR